MKQNKKGLAILLAFAMIVSSLFGVTPSQAATKKKKVKLNKTKLSLYVGKTYTLKLKNNKKKIKWSTSNKKVATVSSKGKVKGKKKGSATITAKVGKKKYKCKVTVKVKKKPATQKPAATQKPTQTQAPTPTPMIVASDANFPNATETSVREIILAGTKADAYWYEEIEVQPSNAALESLHWESSDPNIASVDKSGYVQAEGVGTVMISATTKAGKKISYQVKVEAGSNNNGIIETGTAFGNVTCHDPSVVKGNDGYYYIFGSHLAFARTDNFIGWDIVTDNLTSNRTNDGSILADYWNNWAKYNSSGTENKDNYGNNFALADNQWAPDVIYNKAMKKWCMYMSVNGPDLNSVIVLLTADKLDGDWTVVGPVIYSGFCNKDGLEGHNYTFTDYKEVTGDSSLPGRYCSGTNYNSNYQTNAIDPCVKYDKDGSLWMSYGSWFGGIYFIKLDANTGLRDNNYKFQLDTDDSDGTTSDPYLGIRVAGGRRSTGEASYFIEKDGWYYMFLSYGGLNAAGNYNMRVYRSRNLTGPYQDNKGKYPLRTDLQGIPTNGELGIRLMAGYKWSCNSNAYLAQGHNSALVDDDGKMYLVYHTRFSDKGELHHVRTHQMFMNEEEWLCVAPYTYNNEKISSSGYSYDEVVGTYEYLVQTPSTAGGAYVTSKEIKLNSDGSVSGAASGFWTMTEGKPYMKITSGGVVYSGVFSYGYDESTDHKKVMTFSAVGTNNVCIWGSKK